MIGGFREWDDVNDPRRSRGSAPQPQNITGLPALGDPARAAVLAARREEIARRRNLEEKLSNNVTRIESATELPELKNVGVA